MGNCFQSGTAEVESKRRPAAWSDCTGSGWLPAEEPDAPVLRIPVLAALPAKVSLQSSKLLESRSTAVCSELKEKALCRRRRPAAPSSPVSAEPGEAPRRPAPLLEDPRTSSSISRRRAGFK